MSDLQELIATSSINAFNSGYQLGGVHERERIIELLKDYSDGELLVIPTGQIQALIKNEGTQTNEQLYG